MTQEPTKTGVGLVASRPEALEGARNPDETSVRRYGSVLVSAGEPFVFRAIVLGLGWLVGPGGPSKLQIAVTVLCVGWAESLLVVL